MQRFNLNKNIYVRLTEEGERIIREKDNDYIEMLKSYGSFASLDEAHLYEEMYIKNKINGYSKFELWRFIQIFGSEIDILKKPPFEMDILIEEKDLRWVDGISDVKSKIKIK